MALKYKCPKCGAIGDDIIYSCCSSNTVYVTKNLNTNETTYECDDVEDASYVGCHVCGCDIDVISLGRCIIEVDE